MRLVDGGEMPDRVGHDGVRWGMQDGWGRKWRRRVGTGKWDVGSFCYLCGAMYYISKKIRVAASHHLVVDYATKCARPHGHNYEIEVFCKAPELDANGMVVDFKLIKERVIDRIDHRDLNEVLPFNPTAENLARWICGEIPHCYKVTVKETEDNTATYEL